jgi:hypothetical protein
MPDVRQASRVTTILFVDRLCAASAWRAWRHGAGRIRVLDFPERGGVGRALLWMLGALGRDAQEASFFAGHLSAPSGEPVFVAARRAASDVSLRAAREIVGASAGLRLLNDSFGRNTIELYIARRLMRDVERALMHIQVAGALAGPGSDAVLLLENPLAFDRRVLTDVPDGLTLMFYRSASARQWLRSAAVALGHWLLPIVRRWRAPRATPGSAADAPGVLVPQEEHVGLDRSYRGQPHWLSADDPLPGFRTWVLANPSAEAAPAEHAALREQGIAILDPDAVSAIAASAGDSPTDRTFAAAVRASVRGALGAARAPERHAYAQLTRLLARADVLARLCRALKVRAFVAGDAHLLDVDAVQLFAELSGITTLTFQYSNLAFPTATMLTTTDIMATFSSRFHPLWKADGIAPRAFVETGYVYDFAFARVRGRSAQWRRQLADAGARFVVCYFDESVTPHKYGLISLADHLLEVQALARWLLADPTAGVIVKSQFQRNAPSRLHEHDDTLARARTTGRYLELTEGTQRNVVFPCEAAQASDFAIGHVVGATAALEAALAGTPCALLNSHRIRTFNDDLYSRGRIVFASIDEALAAVAKRRRDESSCHGLGDWSACLDEFDPYRDGRAAERMRALIERVATGRPSGEAAAPAATMVTAR